KIMASSERMSVLINDILNFSKVSRNDVAYVPVNLEVIFENVLQDLELEIEAKNVRIQKETLPQIEAIPIQMNQLLFNLISNSLKFARPDLPLQITIKVKDLVHSPLEELKNLNKSLDYVQITFADNGIGFEQQYSEKIFHIFQRLNNRSYAGTGIGLALCKRIVETHKGEIIAQSNPNEGATFNIMLPKKHILFTP
ncbi:MAG: ATP-binding protein, partial [Ferruginibacter sp.]